MSAPMNTRRLPTKDDPDFGTFGRFQETPVDEMPPDTREAYESTMRLRGLVPGPCREPREHPQPQRVCANRVDTEGGQLLTQVETAPIT